MATATNVSAFDFMSGTLRSILQRRVHWHRPALRTSLRRGAEVVAATGAQPLALFPQLALAIHCPQEGRGTGQQDQRDVGGDAAGRRGDPWPLKAASISA